MNKKKLAKLKDKLLELLITDQTLDGLRVLELYNSDIKLTKLIVNEFKSYGFINITSADSKEHRDYDIYTIHRLDNSEIFTFHSDGGFTAKYKKENKVISDRMWDIIKILIGGILGALITYLLKDCN